MSKILAAILWLLPVSAQVSLAQDTSSRSAFDQCVLSRSTAIHGYYYYFKVRSKQSKSSFSVIMSTDQLYMILQESRKISDSAYNLVIDHLLKKKEFLALKRELPMLQRFKYDPANCSEINSMKPGTFYFNYFDERGFLLKSDDQMLPCIAKRLFDDMRLLIQDDESGDYLTHQPSCEVLFDESLYFGN